MSYCNGCNHYQRDSNARSPEWEAIAPKGVSTCCSWTRLQNLFRYNLISLAPNLHAKLQCFTTYIYSSVCSDPSLFLNLPYLSICLCFISFRLYLHLSIDLPNSILASISFTIFLPFILSILFILFYSILFLLSLSLYFLYLSISLSFSIFQSLFISLSFFTLSSNLSHSFL